MTMVTMKRIAIVGLAAAAVSCSILTTVVVVNYCIGLAAVNDKQQVIETQINNDDRSSSNIMTIGNNIGHNRRRRLQQVKHLDCTNGQCNEVINNDEQVTPSDVTAQLQDAPSRLTEEQRKQRIKAFLGGLYPHLDDNMLPKYLRDSMPREKLSVMDIWDLDKDVAYFWHIPKVRGVCLIYLYNYSTL